MPKLDASGVFTICPTPFDDELNVDYASIGSLVQFLGGTGVTGLAILGFMGEAHNLSELERRQVTREFIAAADKRLPVWVGLRGLGLPAVIEQAAQAREMGAAAVFVAPPDVGGDGYLFDYYEAVARSIDIPVIIHDFPASFGTQISPAVVRRLALEGHVHAIKMEEPPVGQKITAILSGLNDPERMRVFGGLGGVFFLEELYRGAVGTMTGFAFPEILVSIYDKFTSGDTEAAAALFDRYCPLLRYEFQPKIGLALRKYIYQRRGAIRSHAIRPPGMRIDEKTIRELESTVQRVGLKL